MNPAVAAPEVPVVANYVLPQGCVKLAVALWHSVPV
jgi:hypothetical protein